MIKEKIKSNQKIVSTKIEVANLNLNSKAIQIQKRKIFFEHALANSNNNPFRIVIL
jgi:hypothetical protein